MEKREVEEMIRVQVNEGLVKDNHTTTTTTMARILAKHWYIHV